MAGSPRVKINLQASLIDANDFEQYANWVFKILKQSRRNEHRSTEGASLDTLRQMLQELWQNGVPRENMSRTQMLC